MISCSGTICWSMQKVKTTNKMNKGIKTNKKMSGDPSLWMTRKENRSTQIITNQSYSMAGGVKKYDFYRKAIDGLQTKTSMGGLGKLVLLYIHSSFHYIRSHYCFAHMPTNCFLLYHKDFNDTHCTSANGRCYTNEIGNSFRSNALWK